MNEIFSLPFGENPILWTHPEFGIRKHLCNKLQQIALARKSTYRVQSWFNAKKFPFQDLVDAFLKTFPDAVHFRDSTSRDGFSEERLYWLPNIGMVEMVFCISKVGDTTGWTDTSIWTVDESLHGALRAFFDVWCAPREEEERGSIYMVVATKTGLEFRPVGVGGADLERDNYEEPVLAAFDRICEGLTVEKPRGRLSILNGPPGTGKSFLIRGLLNACPKTAFVFVSPGDVVQLSSPSYIPSLLEFHNALADRSITFIVEDADEILASRDVMNMSSVSSLLNFSDGLLASIMDVRFVCTTNAKTLELDKALKRPGRLCVHCNVGDLSPEKAAKVYTRLTKKEKQFDEPISVAEIYTMAYDEGWTAPEKPKKQLGFAPPMSSEDRLLKDVFGFFADPGDPPQD